VISFRFHLVSLVAVFLALGLGVLTGTTVLNRGIVAQLERQTDQLVRGSDDLREDVRRLEERDDMWSAFGDSVMTPLVSGRLTNRPVLIVTQEGTDENSIDGAQAVLEDAGAEIRALLSVSGRMGLAAPADREALAEVLGEQITDPEALLARAAEVLAERLAFGPNGNTDVLAGLLREGLVVDQGPQLDEAALRELGGPDQPVVVVGGGPDPDSLDPSGFLVPLTRVMAEAGLDVAAAEPMDLGEAGQPFVEVLRGDGEVSALIATQDNVDQVPGQIGLVLALQDLMEGASGHYGVKDGASSAIPELAP
jgi:hypothetical protein